MSTFKKYMEIIQESKTKEIKLDSIEEEEDNIRNMGDGDVIYVKNNKNKRIFAISKNATDDYSISNVNLTNKLFIANSPEDLLDRIKKIGKKPKAKEDINAEKDTPAMNYPTEGEALENKFWAIRRKMENEVKTGRKMF